MKTILGLDLGTNSIGWALIQQDFKEKQGKILGMGSRIIPMTQDVLDKFSAGAPTVTQTAERTNYRSVRRLRERNLLRRERLHRVLNILNILPKHYAEKIDFKERLGKFLPETETKLVYNDDNQFVFKNSFNEMLEEFRKLQPELLSDGKKIPYDWTIYYLRKKALSKKIEKDELAWLILNFNQKRGYFQLRGEDDDAKVDDFEIIKTNILEVEKKEKDKRYEKYWYEVKLENGLVYRAAFYSDIFHWQNQEREFVVKKTILKDGSEKIDISYLPTFEEIEKMEKKQQDKLYVKIKLKTEKEIDNSDKTVGEYIFNALLKNPDQKIKGKLVRTIERKFYKEELTKILKKQTEFHSELQSKELLNSCVEELYPRNEERQKLLKSKDFVYLFIEDILFYQRPLKSQKHNIGNCSLESRTFIKNGVKITEFLKTVSRSHPFFQEFRLWQWIQNLKIYEKQTDENITEKFLSNEEDYENLFDFLWNRKEINHKALLEFLVGTKFTDLKTKQITAKAKEYRWNYVYDEEKDESKNYPTGETFSMIKSRLDKIEDLPKDFLTEEILHKLWHIIYSVTDKIEYEKALKTFAQKNGINEEQFVESFKKFPPFKSEYASYSLKAIKKLLPLMRMGKFWNENEISEETNCRLNSIKERLQSIDFDEKKLAEVSDDDILRPILKSFRKIGNQAFNKGLNTYQASYAVYNKHSEGEVVKWNSVSDLEKYLEEFKQHSLRNPIVEQILTETLRVVRDIWQEYGNGEKDFFHEIHIELGRELKNPADERKRLTSFVTQNENTNLRIKALLAEMLNEGVENVRPYSPTQQEILKIYEDGVLNSAIEIPEEILKISTSSQPTSAQLQRYKLWLEQKYKSPYTGQIIPLNKLFTSDYEIEHVIPQSKYFDDSFNNKIICESVVNGKPYKENQLGLQFIKNQGGRVVEELCKNGKIVTILKEDEYKDFVNTHYGKSANRNKRKILLLEEIPEQMIERQMNDTRYISKHVMQLLSNIVRSEDGKDDGVNSKNVLSLSGKMTSELKNDWGLNDIWNDLILSRFERLNHLTQTKNFTTYNEKHQKDLPTIPLELQKGFQKKRIDHRHHSLDALVIASITRNHINYLNNQNALDEIYKKKFYTKEELQEKRQKTREDLRAQLCDKKYNDESSKNYQWTFKKPWANFTKEAKDNLDSVVVSFKQNLRVINKTVNYYEKYNDEGKKILVKQTKGENWAIRKPLHKETVYAKVDLPRIKVPKGKILTASRKILDTTFTLNNIENITDTGIQKILNNYLKEKENPELAFSPEGIEELNQNITKYNDGVPHKPIYKVRVFETGSRFPLGQSGNKKDKYVESAKGTNLFFAIYQNRKSERSYETIPLNEVLERQKQGLPSAPVENSKGERLLFTLSPNDLVYLPMSEEQETPQNVDFENLTKEKCERIYKFVDSSDTTANFVPLNIASLIFNKTFKDQQKIGVSYPIQNELGLGSPQSKNQKSINGLMIKSVCWKLETNRLGKITKVIK